MYTVYVDDEIMYSPMLSDKGYSMTKGKITKELNKAGSFEFTIPPSNIMYSSLQKLKSIVKVTIDNEPTQGIVKEVFFKRKSPNGYCTIYKTAVVDEETNKIILSDPLNTKGSSRGEQFENYSTYKYFYGDYSDGSSDSNAYEYDAVTRSVTSSGGYVYNCDYYSLKIATVFIEKEVFYGRIIHEEKDFYNRKVVYCEGQLAFLLDSIQRPYTFQGDIPELFSQFIENHNDQVDLWKQFQVGKVTVKDPNSYINRESSKYPNTFNELNEKLLKTHGGYLVVRLENGVRYLDYLQKSGKTNSQVIEFGKNILDITEYVTAEDVFTILIPLGAKDEDGTARLTIETVNDGKDYIESDLGISLFGKITKVNEWDDVTIADNLLTKGNSLLESSIEESVSITLKAIDLHLIDVNSESISIGDEVRVVSPPHNIDTFFRCSKIELNIFEPDKSVYTFGASSKTLTDKI